MIQRESGVPHARITGTGRFVPERVLTNAELETMVDTSDEWIRTRTGIRERRIAAPGVGTAEMGAASARPALAEAGVPVEAVDLILVSTSTPDRLMPSTGCDIQAILGAGNAAAYDIMTACAGFPYGLSLAQAHIAAGQAETVLVVCSEKMSSIVDWGDRSTCVIFGDGAASVVVQRGAQENGRILSSFMKSDGSLAELLYRPAGGTRIPIDIAVLDERSHMIRMAGPEVFKSAVRSMSEASEIVLQRAGLTGEDVDILIPHQANIRIIEATAKYAGIPMEKVYVNVDRFGNTSSASIPLALDEAKERGRVKPGDVALMVAFGAGFTWGANVVRL
jgi:3-oxoacyl-[acyl-carrier-protein] synthase III